MRVLEELCRGSVNDMQEECVTYIGRVRKGGGRTETSPILAGATGEVAFQEFWYALTPPI